MKLLILLSTFLLCPALSTKDDDYPLYRVPDRIKACLAESMPLARSKLVLDSARNPYYLRGDFDGDGRPDLAIALKSKTVASQVGIGICRDKLPPVLLGSIAKAKPFFDDDPRDGVESPGWVVVTRAELFRILKKTNPRRQATTGIMSRIAAALGEMIYMPYEDSEGVIYYWHGQFRWYTINSIDFPQEEPVKQ